MKVYHSKILKGKTCKGKYLAKNKIIHPIYGGEKGRKSKARHGKGSEEQSSKNKGEKE